MPAENLTMYEKSSGTGTTIEYRVEKDKRFWIRCIRNI